MLAIVIVFGLIAVALYIATFVILGQNKGSTEDWNIIKSNLTKVWIMTISASIALFIATTMYYKEVQGRDYFMLFMLGIACLSFSLSVCAFGISMIAK